MWNPKSSSFLHGNIPLKLLKTGGRGGLNKFLHREALPQGLTPCLFIHYLYGGRSRGEDRGAGDWALPYLRVWMPPLPPHPAYLKVWIGTALTEKVTFVFRKPFIDKCEMLPLSHT